MKNSIKLLTLSSALLLTGFGAAHSPKEAPLKAESFAQKKAVSKEAITKYISMEDPRWVEDGLVKRLANRNDGFWNGRSFNALDRFYRGEAGEGEQGNLVSPTWHQTGDYVTFTLGGKATNSFVGIFNANDDVNVASPLVRIDNHEWFMDPARCSNMGVRVIDATPFKGKEVKLALIDRDNAGFGFFNFGALQVNQTKAEVAATIDVHKNILAKGAPFGQDGPENSNDEAHRQTLEWYKRAEYAPFIEANGTLDRYNLDFENIPNRLELFGSDTSFEGGRNDLDFFYDLILSNREAYWWGEAMPFNKTGERFLCTHTGMLLPDNLHHGSTGELEAARMRFVTPAFTLSGSGFLSVKMGGASAALHILDENNQLLAEVRNPAFITGVDVLYNVMETQVNMNTMVRTVIDASEFLGRKIRIGLVDLGAQDGIWSYPNFDELVTYYEGVPSFRVDTLTQTHGNPVRSYHGERLDYFVSTSVNTHPEAKAAYEFLYGQRDAANPIGTNGYYATARAHANKATFCGLDAKALGDLVARYDALSPEAKAIVNHSQDYQHIVNPDQAWFDVAADTAFTVGDSMGYIRSRAAYLGNGSQFLRDFASVEEAGTTGVILAIAAIGLVAASGAFLLRKKKQH